jgi:anti-sigma regulatory factor (Ser/Thr protein kinase)
MQENPLTVPAKLESLADVTAFVLAAADAAGLGPQARYRLRLAVDELATNIVTHGYPNAPGHGPMPTIEVRTRTDEKALTVILEDAGIPFDPRQVPAPADLHLPPEQRALGGLGVHLALTGVDQFQYERVGDRNRNVLVVRRVPAAEHPPA